jgi:Protein of unknown function (DUF3261)
MTRGRALLLVAALAACRPPAQPSPPPATELGASFLARQTVIVRHREQLARLDVVLQYDGDALLLLGLTPMGTKAFALRQRNATIELTRFVDMPLPAPPAAILLDIHRAYFDDRPTRALPDGWHRRGAGSRSIHERWAAGKLYERIWGPRRARAATRVRWPDGIAPGALPRRVEIDHPELELTLEIHTLEHRAIDRAAAPH